MGLTQAGEPTAKSELNDAAIAVTDQFVDYVPELDEQLLAPLREHLGKSGLRDFLEALYIFDQTARLRVAHGRLFEPGEFDAQLLPSVDEGRVLTPTRANMRWHDAPLAQNESLMRNALDSTTRELVR